MSPGHVVKCGDGVRMVTTKWGGSPHWEYDAIYLGSDEHGDWLGAPIGTRYSRPGREFVGDFDSVICVPIAPWVAAFNTEPSKHEIYVDMTTVPIWDGPVVTCVDLDLDVVKARDERGIFLDDEDEFAEHQIAYGYPPEIVAMTERSGAEVLRDVLGRIAPFDGSHLVWLAALRTIGPN